MDGVYSCYTLVKRVISACIRMQGAGSFSAVALYGQQELPSKLCSFTSFFRMLFFVCRLSIYNPFIPFVWGEVNMPCLPQSVNPAFRLFFRAQSAVLACTHYAAVPAWCLQQCGFYILLVA
jgi:hypothetical protein